MDLFARVAPKREPQPDCCECGKKNASFGMGAPGVHGERDPTIPQKWYCGTCVTRTEWWAEKIWKELSIAIDG